MLIEIYLRYTQQSNANKTERYSSCMSSGLLGFAAIFFGSRL
jgi:hypothetical protein